MDQVAEEHATINQARHAKKLEKVGFLKQVRNIIGRSRTALIFIGVLGISPLKTASAEPVPPSGPNTFYVDKPELGKNMGPGNPRGFDIAPMTPFNFRINGPSKIQLWFFPWVYADEQKRRASPLFEAEIMVDQNLYKITPEFLQRGDIFDNTKVYSTSGEIALWQNPIKTQFDIPGGNHVVTITTQTYSVRVMLTGPQEINRTSADGTSTIAPPQLYFACKLIQSPDDPSQFVIEEITSIPLSGLHVMAREQSRSQNNEILAKVSLVCGKAGESGFVQYDTDRPFVVGVGSLCRFERTIPHVTSEERSIWYEREQRIAAATKRLNESREINDSEKKYWLGLISNGNISDVQLEELLKRLGAEREREMEKIYGTTSDGTSHPDISVETTDNPRELTKQIDAARSRGDYKKAADFFDKLFAIPDIRFSNGSMYAIAAETYARAGELKKAEAICDRGVQEAEHVTDEGKKDFIDLLGECSGTLIAEKINPEKGLKYLFTMYSLQTGGTDKQALLTKIASNQADALMSVMALQNAGKYQEAADLLVFYFKANPALMEWRNWGQGHKSCPTCLIAGELKREGAPAAADYLETKRTEGRWARGIERVLRIAVPIVVVGGALIKHDYEEREKARIKAQREAEEVARQRQIARDRENARRRAQGLPSLEEEERRESERRETIKGQTRARCLENCQTQYHSCMGLVDPRCCGPNAPYLPCITGRCHTECESGLSSCRSGCD